MKEYLTNYINEVESKLDDKITKKDIENHLNKINFFSHERLIHLIVTMFFALFTMLFIYFSVKTNSCLFIVITIVLIIIENNVQYLYKLYDEMNKKVK